MPTRLVILADVHLGLPETQFPNQDYTYSVDLLRQAIPKIDALRPDKVIVLGDLVNMGTASEWKVAREILEPFSDKLEVLLGNHELLKGMISHWQEVWNQPPFRASEIESLPVIYLSSGIENLPPTQWGGSLNDAQFTLLENTLAGYRDEPVIIFSHHPLTNTVRRSDRPMFGLDDSVRLEALLSQHPHDVILFTGHTHHQNVFRRGNLTCIACPPLCFWPHGFLVIDIEGKTLSFSTIRLFTSHDQSPDRKVADAEYRAAGEGVAADQAGSFELR